jgi:Zn ribbon nucleic-acid-binding protein
MKLRTGKECSQITCINYDSYSHWSRNLGSDRLKECMNCKHAHVSQYKRQEVNNDKRNIVYH